MRIYHSKICISTVKAFTLCVIVERILTTVGAIGEVCLLTNALLYDGICIQCSQHIDRIKNFDCFDDGRPMASGGQRELVGEITFTKICCLKNKAFLRTIKIRRAAVLLNGKQLKVVTILRPPFSKIHGNIYDGVIFELLKAVQKKYNFSMVTFLPYDGNWGSKLMNGTWTGMIGMVKRKESDVGAAAFSVTLERSRVIDFTMAFHQEPTAILLPPPTSGEKFTVLIRPLSKYVWATVFLTVFLLVPSLYVLHRVDNSILGNYRQTNFGDLLWFLTGSILQQGLNSPVEKSTRFLTAIWWAMTLVIANIYIAFLVSYLSNPKLYNLVDSLEALSMQKKIKWTFRTNTAHRSLFKSESSTGTYKVIGTRSAESDLVLKDVDGISLVLQGKFAFIKEKSYLDVAIADDYEKVKKCRLTLAKQKFFTVGLALVLEKNSPYTPVFDYEISCALATGIMDYWKKDHWPHSRLLVCTDAASYIVATQSKARKLTLDDLQGAYFLLVCGLVFSILGFFLEQFNFRARDKFHKVKLSWKISRIWKFLR